MQRVLAEVIIFPPKLSIPGFGESRTETKATAEIKREHRASALTENHRVAAAATENA